MSGMKVTLQIEMKLTYIAFKSLVGGGAGKGDEGEVRIDVLGSGLRKISFLPAWLAKIILLKEISPGRKKSPLMFMMQIENENLT